MVKRVSKIFLTVFLVLFLLLGTLLIALQYPSVQTYTAQRVTALLSNSLGTKVSIGKVEIDFFNKLHFINFYLEDHQGDTLISARELEVRFQILDLFQKKINVNRIYLEGAKVFLHRDSTGEKMNIAEVFKSFKSNTPADTESPAGKFSWHINLQELEIAGVDFRYLDEKSNTDVQVFLPSCMIDLHKASISEQIIHIRSARIDGTRVAIDLMKRMKSPEDTSVMDVHFMPGNMQIRFDELALTNTYFRLDDHNIDTIRLKGIDFKHLEVKDIQLFALGGYIVADTILTEVKQLSASERSGFRLDSLNTLARVTTKDISLDRLSLKTPNSEITNHLGFQYSAFHDFKDFLHGVSIKANFNRTRFSLKDLNYFLPQLDKLEHNQFFISGNIDGTVSNLRGKSIEIRYGSGSVFKGDFFTNGLPDLYEAFLTLRVNRLATNIADIKRFYPSIRFPENLNTLGVISYSGSLDGFLTDFVSNGRVVTDIGSAETDVNFKYDRKNNKASYKGSLSLHEFDLGVYFGDSENLGKVSLVGNVNGTGLTPESLNVKLDGNVSSLTLRKYDYRNVQVDGSVIKKSFHGSLMINDDNLDMDFNGKADFSEAVPEFNFEAHVRRAFLKNLNLSKADIRLSADMVSDFSGAKPDDIVGAFRLNNVTLVRDSVIAYSKYFTLDVRNVSAQRKEVHLNADFAEAEMEGNFTFSELPRALISFAKYAFTEDYTDTAQLVGQNFTVDIRIFEPQNLTRILSPGFHLIRNSRIQGSFSSVAHRMNLKATIPELIYNNFNLKRINASAFFENGSFDLLASADKVYNGDSLLLDTLSVHSATMENKDFRFDFMVAGKDYYNYANITAFLTPLKDKSSLRLEPSDVKLGNYYWKFNEGNNILIEGKKITTNNLVFRTSDQTVFISSYLKNDTSTSIKLTLDNTEMGDFTGIFTTKMNDLHGAVNGKLVVEDVFYKPNVFADLVVNDFTLGKELVGDVNIESRLDEGAKKIWVYSSVKSVNNLVEAKGYISIDPAKPEINIDVKAPRLGLNFLNYKFFERYVKNCRGYAVVDAQVTGTIRKPLLLGSVSLMNDTVTVSFLNTTYRIGEHRVVLDKDGFDIGSITIYDVNNSPIYGNGRINHKSFKDFALNLRVNTPRGQFLNTTAKHSPNFYGVAFGRGSISFNGPISSPVIKGYALTLPGTHCNLPVNQSFETGRYSFYKFTDKSEKAAVTQVLAPPLKLNGVNFVLELEATPDARIDIILDPVTGDVLTGYGRGNLKIEIPKAGNTTIYGSYEIERGSYFFTLQNLVNKRFEINRGSTINFTGDAYKSAINVTATYEVRSSVTDLISDLIFTTSSSSESASQLESAARSRIPIKLTMNMTGILERPNIAFDIQAIDPDPIVKTYVDQRLAMLKTNEKEMNNQVFGLLVMNRFLPTQGTNNTNGIQGYIGGTATNTVSELLSSQFSNYINNLIGYSGNEALQNFELNVGYRQYDQSSNTQPSNPQAVIDTRREVQLALQQRLLNNRLTINAGGNLDFGNSTTVDGVQGGSRTVIPTGDFQVQYALTKDGRWKAKAFNRTNYDYFNSRNNNRTGVGISFSKEFDKPSELFLKKKKKKKEQAKGSVK